MSVKNKVKLLKSLNLKFDDFNSDLNSLHSSVKMCNEIDNTIFQSMQNADIKKFSANSPDEIIEIAKRIDLNA